MAVEAKYYRVCIFHYHKKTADGYQPNKRQLLICQVELGTPAQLRKKFRKMYPNSRKNPIEVKERPIIIRWV